MPKQMSSGEKKNIAVLSCSLDPPRPKTQFSLHAAATQESHEVMRSLAHIYAQDTLATLLRFNVQGNSDILDQLFTFLIDTFLFSFLFFSCFLSVGNQSILGRDYGGEWNHGYQVDCRYITSSPTASILSFSFTLVNPSYTSFSDLSPFTHLLPRK